MKGLMKGFEDLKCEEKLYKVWDFVVFKNLS